ncbi:hypothetical protein [Candidatus Methanoplasma termitum]|nr:hypothetical protein [Candidatus Methanoplasma termitum]
MGLVIIIAGIISLIGGIVAAITAVMEINGLDNLLPQVLKAIGALVVGIGLLWCGINIRKASDGSAALRIFVRVFGLIIIVKAILDLIGVIVGPEDFTISGTLVAFIIQLIIGCLILWVGNKIAGKNKNVLSKILWIILIIAFIVLAIMELLALLSLDLNADGALGLLIVGICMFIAFLMALVLCFSPDVKKAML